MWKSEKVRWFCFAIAVALVGCAHGQRSDYRALEREIRQAAPEPELAQEPFKNDKTFTRTALIRAVLARNPNLESARLAWRAVLARQPQATSLGDLDVDYSLAPASINSNDVRFGQMIRLHQRFPWPGKLRLAGETALAKAEVAQAVYESVRLDLALMASMLFDEYAKIVRLLELNEEHRTLTEDIKATAVAQYSAGRAPQQEPLQAEVELSHVVHQRVLLESDRAVAVAKLNQLMHRAPRAPLGLPKRRPFAEVDVATSEALQKAALEQRPEIRAQDSRVRGRESARALEKRGYFPDFGLMGEYNSMWQQTEHQWMIGASLNLPIQIKPRRAAVDEANAALSQAKAARDGVADGVRSEVEQARQRLLEAQHVVGLYRSRLLPAARAQIDAAEIGYETGQNSFQALIDAERSLRTLEVQYEEVLSSLGQRKAQLERSMGRVPGLSNEGDAP